jgi:uncharacterized protein YqgV (UPF0045/DUF77 family)
MVVALTLFFEATMRTAVEISLYPLATNYIPPIQDFIDRLNTYPGLTVLTNAMSTQIVGEHELVFAALAKETAQTFSEGGRRVFVMKVLGGNDVSSDSPTAVTQ